MRAAVAEADIEIRILHVPDCPNVTALRALVQRCLVTLGLHATIEEVEGAYPSPTLLINGIDVHPQVGVAEASCRLDLPTEAEILDTLTRISS
jgi:hypothetical protein